MSLAAAGCAQQGVGVPAASTKPSTAAEVTQRPTAEQSPRTLTFDIGPMGFATEVDGTVVVDVGDGGYTLAVTVDGLRPGAHYPVNFHHGSCPLPDTSWDSWLDQGAETDENGTLRVEKTYTKSWEVPLEGLTLTIHGVVPLDARTHIGCADLTEQ